ncbi:PilZ domain-containing protein [Brevundimonas sp.]|uniref:PilZ domain-containing protein n=1 Tax=Brevundimonas sp. TaxID=1871086 RepID=UPI00391A70CE
MLFRKTDDRRSEPRRLSNARGLVVAPGLELGCAIVDESPGGLRFRLQRDVPLPEVVVVVNVAEGVAREGRVAWKKGHEAGLKVTHTSRVSGLVPQRFAAARDAWLRAGGR